MCTIFQKFDLYDSIIAHDYMQHEAITAGLRQKLAAFKHPIRVIDVGCGNGQMARGSLRDAVVAEYVGVDLSADALERVRATPPLGLKPTEGKLDLRCDDLFVVLPSLPANSFDVVLASFSLHHFSQSQKCEVLSAIERILAPGGKFIWTDVSRKTGQTREEFNATLAKEMRENWIKLEMWERECVVTHIEKFDFPEELEWMIARTGEAGLNNCTPIYRDDYFGSWVFTR